MSTTRLINLESFRLKEVQSLLSRLDLYPVSEIDGIYGAKTYKAWKTFKETYYLSDPDLISDSSLSKLRSQANDQPILILRSSFDEIFRYARPRDRDLYFLPINKALKEFEINTIQRIAAFLATVSHESGNLRYSSEIASGADYEWRKDLGNIHKGDGIKYKGRGLIQLTGAANYRVVGKALGIDLEGNPFLASSPLISTRIAGYFWFSHGLNQLADHNDFRTITRRVNGGYNGYDDRVRRWQHAKEVLGC